MSEDNGNQRDDDERARSERTQDADGRFAGRHAAGDDEGRDGGGLSALAQDAAHPFDQTNGIVDGLDGDAGSPENADDRMDDESTVPVVPVGGSAGNRPGLAPAVFIGDDQNKRRDAEADSADKDDPQGP